MITFARTMTPGWGSGVRTFDKRLMPCAKVVSGPPPLRVHQGKSSLAKY